MTSPDELRASTIAALAADTLRAGAEVKFRAVGASMIPAIWPGDVLTIKPASGSLPKVGAVALTLAHGGLRAHRVVERSGAGAAGFIRTRGDALASCDAIAEAVEVLGMVVARNGRPLAAASGLVERLNRMSGHLPLRWLRLKCRALRLRASAVESSWLPFSSHREVA